MNIYLILLTSTIVSLFIHRKTKVRFFAMFPYILMAFVGGFRSEVGVDYLSYKTQFYEIVDEVGWSLNFEPGFRFLVKCIDALGFSYQLLFVIASAFTCLFYYKFIEDNSCSFELSTMMFMCLGPFYFASYNAVRQVLAIAIFLYALKYLNKELKKYLIWLLIAATIHVSAIVFIIIPLVAKVVAPFFKRMRKAYFLLLFLGIAVVFTVLRSDIADRVISTFFSSRIRMTEYTAKMDMSYLAYLIVCMIVLVINRCKKLNIKPVFIYMVIYTCVLISVAFFVPQYSMFLTRFVSWGTPAIIITLPELKRAVRPQAVYKWVVYCGCIGYYLMLINSTGARLLPYATNLQLFK